MALHDTSHTGETHLASLRIERGAEALGVDNARLGTVEQVVVDRETGEMRALVVRAADGVEREVSVAQVERATGMQVYLRFGQRDFTGRSDLARSYDPAQYVPVDTGEIVSETQASRVARNTAHPVVTEVEPDAVELVAPQTEENTLVSDELAPTVKSNAVRASETGSAVTDTAATDTAVYKPKTLLDTGATAPTMALPGRGKAQDAQPKTSIERETMKPLPPDQAPPVTPSRLSSVEGDLVGGKPSTGGIGSASAVPADTDADTPGAAHDAGSFDAPRLSEGQASQPGTDTMTLLDTAAEQDTMAPSAPAETTLTMTPIAEEPLTPPLEAELARNATPTIPLAPNRMTSQGSLSTSTETGTRSALDGALALLNTPVARAVAGVGLGLGVALGVALARRQRATPSQKLQRTAKTTSRRVGRDAAKAQDSLGRFLGKALGDALKATQRTGRQGQAAVATTVPSLAQTSAQAAQAAQDAAKATAKQATEATKGAQQHAKEVAKVTTKQTSETAKGARRTAKRTAKRTARRVRWFRNGLMLGSALGVLFAPKPGTELRAQVVDLVENLRSRIA